MVWSFSWSKLINEVNEVGVHHKFVYILPSTTYHNTYSLSDDPATWQ